MSPLDFVGKKPIMKDSPKVEEVIAPVAEKTIPAQPEKQVQNIMIHSEIDSMLLDRLKSQPQT